MKTLKDQIVDEVMKINSETLTKEQVKKIFYNIFLNRYRDFCNSELRQRYLNSRSFSGFSNDSLANFLGIYEEITKVIAKSQNVSLIDYTDEEFTSWVNFYAYGCHIPEECPDVLEDVDRIVNNFLTYYNKNKLDRDFVSNELSDISGEADSKYVDGVSVSKIYSELCTQTMQRGFIKDKISEIAPALIEAFNLTEEDCLRNFSWMEDNIDIDRYIDYFEMQAERDCFLMGRQMLEDEMFEVMFNKFREEYDSEYRAMEDELIATLDEHLTSVNKKDIVKVGVSKLATRIMETFNEIFGDIQVTEDMLTSFADDCDVYHMFRALYELGYEDCSTRQLSIFKNIISRLKDYIPYYLEEKKKRDYILSLESEDVTSTNYLKGNSERKILDYLNNKYSRDSYDEFDDYFEESDKISPLQVKFDNMSREELSELEKEVIEYVKERVRNLTGHNLCRGVLSEEFINSHKAELIKIFANSDYDDRTIVQMVEDVIKQNVIVEPNM